MSGSVLAEYHRYGAARPVSLGRKREPRGRVQGGGLGGGKGKVFRHGAFDR